jgi:hypothetical protein
VLTNVTVMRAGSNVDGDDNDYLLSSPAPSPGLLQPPTPTHLKSPVGMTPMQAMPANVMSPDEMLRAYTQQRRPSTGAGMISYLAPVANYNGNGMRTLYSPTTPVAVIVKTDVSYDTDADVGTAQ